MSIRSGLELAAVFVTRGAGAAGGIVLSIVIARIAGPEGLGQFAVFLSLLGVGAIISRRGLDTILIRSVARAVHADSVARIPALLKYSFLVATGTGILLGFLGSIVFTSEVFGLRFGGSVGAFAVSLPVICLTTLVAAYFKGVGRPWISPLLEIGGISLVATILIGIALAFGAHSNLFSLSIVFAIATIFTFIFGAVVALRDIHGRNIDIATLAPISKREQDELRRGQVAFTIIALSGFLSQAGSFAISAPFLPDYELGLARAAERLALLVSFPVLAINPFIATKIVRSMQYENHREIRHLIAKASLVGAALGLPVLAALLIFPRFSLKLIGDEFVNAADFLQLLAIAHYVIVVCGPFSILMAMTGGERQVMRLSVLILVASILSFPAMSKYFGVSGFVTAYFVLAVIKATATGGLALAFVRSRATS